MERFFRTGSVSWSRFKQKLEVGVERGPNGTTKCERVVRTDCGSLEWTRDPKVGLGGGSGTTSQTCYRHKEKYTFTWGTE